MAKTKPNQEQIINDVNYCFDIFIENLAERIEATLLSQIENGDHDYSKADKSYFMILAHKRIAKIQGENNI